MVCKLSFKLDIDFDKLQGTISCNIPKKLNYKFAVSNCEKLVMPKDKWLDILYYEVKKALEYLVRDIKHIRNMEKENYGL